MLFLSMSLATTVQGSSVLWNAFYHCRQLLPAARLSHIPAGHVPVVTGEEAGGQCPWGMDISRLNSRILPPRLIVQEKSLHDSPWYPPPRPSVSLRSDCSRASCTRRLVWLGSSLADLPHTHEMHHTGEPEGRTDWVLVPLVTLCFHSPFGGILEGQAQGRSRGGAKERCSSQL